MKGISVPIILLFFFSSLLLISCQTTSEEQKKPNILFIAVDDLRPEINCFGASHIHSPNFDRLAEEGIIFREAHCNIPVCGASRASLMTGTRPTRARFINYMTRAAVDNPGAIGIHQHFKDNGYHTISNGKIFHHSDDLAEGWDEIYRPSGNSAGNSYFKPGNNEINNMPGVRGPAYESADYHDTLYRDGQLTMKTIQDLRQLKEQEKPFFLACGFYKPHLPFVAPKRCWDLYDRDDIRLPDNVHAPENAPPQAMHSFGELRNYSYIPEEGQVSDSLAKTLIHGYYACVSHIDYLLGMLMDELKALELEENTIVILWGDHGWNLMEHGLWCKHCNFRTSLRSTLMLKVPGQTGGLQTDALVEFVDIYPTLCELAGIEPPENQLEGESFVPLIEDPSKDWKEFLILKWFDGLTIKTREHAYTEWSRADSAVEARMLYDHKKDLDENINISEAPENEGIMEELSRIMFEHRGSDYNEPVPGKE